MIVDCHFEVELAHSWLILHSDSTALSAWNVAPFDRHSAVLKFCDSYESLCAEVDISVLAFWTSVHNLQINLTDGADHVYTRTTRHAAIVLLVVHGTVIEISLVDEYSAISAICSGYASILGAFTCKPSGVACCLSIQGCGRKSKN